MFLKAINNPPNRICFFPVFIISGIFVFECFIFANLNAVTCVKRLSGLCQSIVRQLFHLKIDPGIERNCIQLSKSQNKQES